MYYTESRQLFWIPIYCIVGIFDLSTQACLQARRNKFPRNKSPSIFPHYTYCIWLQESEKNQNIKREKITLKYYISKLVGIAQRQC